MNVHANGYAAYANSKSAYGIATKSLANKHAAPAFTNAAGVNAWNRPANRENVHPVHMNRRENYMTSARFVSFSYAALTVAYAGLRNLRAALTSVPAALTSIPAACSSAWAA